LKRIMLNIHNCLMAVSIANALNQSGDFLVTSVPSGHGGVAEACKQMSSDILLMESAYDIGTTLNDCLREAELLRDLCPQCKVIMLCDENSVPEIARQVMQAKKDGQIDDFVYSSVSESYLTALLSAI